MLDSLMAPSTKKTVGQIAVAAGTGLLIYDKFERPGAPMGLPLGLIGGGLAVLALTAPEGGGGLFAASGPQEEAIRKEWEAEDRKVHWLPWAVGGVGALLVVRLLLL